MAVCGCVGYSQEQSRSVRGWNDDDLLEQPIYSCGFRPCANHSRGIVDSGKALYHIVYVNGDEEDFSLARSV